MKNKELIKKLQAEDPEAEVIVTSDNFELNNSQISLENVNSYNTGSTKIRGFRDAFDGEGYSKKTWSIIGGHEKVILLS
jgi:hypothetical protein